MGIITNLPSNSNAQTFYQCMPCPENSKGVNGKCYSYDDINSYKTIANPSPEKCSSGTLNPGEYILFLRGGKGGNAGSRLSNKIGKSGGYLAYRFTVYENSNYELCAGGNGNSDTEMGGGGGAGSWLKIGSTYLVAGGGGGAGNSNYGWGQAGGGGAVGAGGGADCSNNHGGKGGSVGIYNSANACACGSDTGCPGAAINNDNAGCGGHNGDRCGSNATGITLYSGSIKTKVGGTADSDGSTTHLSNTSLKFSCSDSSKGCAVLYMFAY